MPRSVNGSAPPGVPGLISEIELYTREELQKRLCVGAGALRTMRREGLPLVRKETRVYFVGRHVIEWFAAASKSEQNR